MKFSVKGVQYELYSRKEFSNNSDIAQAFYEIYAKSYKITWDEFLDRKEKFSNFALVRKDGVIKGGLAFNISTFNCLGEERVSIYCGTTVLADDMRQGGVIQIVGAIAILKAIFTYPTKKKYFWYHARTFNSFVCIPKATIDYFPKNDLIETTEIIALRDSLIDICPDDFGQAGWMSTIPSPREITENVTLNNLSDPAIKLFFDLNPPPGCGVYTIAPISWQNVSYFFLTMGKRILRKKRRYDNTNLPTSVSKHPSTNNPISHASHSNIDRKAS